MTEREIRSLSLQITRMYSAMRTCKYNVGLEVSPVDKNLKKQFDTKVPQHKAWKNITMDSKPISQIIEESGKVEDFVYFTADTDEVIEELEEGKTYIIGGIVDKNRHKDLCVKKAKELGLKVGKLPIGKYIQISGRQVLATSHVYEICCKWFEYKDWGKAFHEVLPQRKLEGKVRKRVNRDVNDVVDEAVESEGNTAEYEDEDQDQENAESLTA
ncbi:hypothetical protein CANTEDRAFT_112270, partial [Yamadazyma tenuis ATCC 10573]